MVKVSNKDFNIFISLLEGQRFGDNIKDFENNIKKLQNIYIVIPLMFSSNSSNEFIHVLLKVINKVTQKTLFLYC